MTGSFWSLGIYFRILFWLITNAAGVVYLVLVCVFAFVNGVVRSVCEAIHNRQLARRVALREVQ